MLFFDRKGDVSIGDTELIQLSDRLTSSTDLPSLEDPDPTRLEYVTTMSLPSPFHPLLSTLDSNNIPVISSDESALEFKRTLFVTSELHMSTAYVLNFGNSNHIDAIPITQIQIEIKDMLDGNDDIS